MRSNNNSRKRTGGIFFPMRPLYAGISVEVGDIWHDKFEPGDLKYGGSIFLGADTIIGPLYLGVGGADGSEGAICLQLNPCCVDRARDEYS